ncbi:zinc metalloprotease HtpX [Coprothermobacter platensis]|uniref:zinc metalloprotease HtpX n=1 Tax=Coprothermobacter platensis TaxID=108819 RepID=UPI00037021F4|nr:zinc metalloprotease HtpX [Coprothermobacter platensis]
MAISVSDTMRTIRLKTFLLMIWFGAIILALGWVIGYLFGNVTLWLTIALVMALMQIWVSYWYSDKIVLASTGTHLVDRNESLEAQTLFDVVEELSIAAGLPMPKVGIMETQEPNAFATGRDPNHAVVVATRGLLQMMNREELSGVIGHELSHVKNRDILLTSMAATLALMVSYLANISWRMMFWGGMGRDRDDRGSNAIVMLIGMLLIFLAPLAATLVRLAVSREREFMADAGSAQITRNPEALASALEKLDLYGKRVPKRAASSTNPAFAELFIVNNVKGDWMTNLFSTHPSTEERIKRLRSMTVY